MGMYGEAAIRATRYVTSGAGFCPRTGWDQAIAELSTSDSSRKKGCPRNAFLGLCEAGRVVGIEVGKYGAPDHNKNGQYALDAHQILKSTPTLSKNKNALWAKAAPPNKRENQQMDVVTALWNKGLLRTTEVVCL
jgi:hypothetical protein